MKKILVLIILMIMLTGCGKDTVVSRNEEPVPQDDDILTEDQF